MAWEVSGVGIIAAMRKFLNVIFFLTLLCIAATQTGLVVFVPELAKVRVGPGTVYDQVGELSAGQTAPAIGRSLYNDWIQVEFVGAPAGQGWVYANLVEVRGGSIEQLPIPEVPPTATLPPTPPGNVDPLLMTQTPTPLPTFTPAPPVVVPTFADSTPTRGGGFPPIWLILGLLIIGLEGAGMAVIRRNA